MKAKPSQAKRILRLTGEADIPVILVIGYPDSVEMPLGLGSSSSAVISEQLQLQLQEITAWIQLWLACDGGFSSH